MDARWAAVTIHHSRVCASLGFCDRTGSLRASGGPRASATGNVGPVLGCACFNKLSAGGVRSDTADRRAAERLKHANDECTRLLATEEVSHLPQITTNVATADSRTGGYADSSEVPWHGNMGAWLERSLLCKVRRGGAMPARKRAPTCSITSKQDIDWTVERC